MNKIEKYSVNEDGFAKLIMSDETAKELRIAIRAFEAGQRKADGQVCMTELGEYIANEYLNKEATEANLEYSAEFDALAKAVKDEIKRLENMGILS